VETPVAAEVAVVEFSPPAPAAPPAATEESQGAEANNDEPPAPSSSAPNAPISWAARAAAHKPEVVKPPVQAPKPRKPVPAPAASATETEAKEATEDATPAPRRERTPYNKTQDTADLEASVFVSGVPHTCGEERLKELFGKHGEVTKVSLKAEKHFAIIDFDSAEAAADALKTTGLRCDGSIMKVEPRRRSGATTTTTNNKSSRGKGESRGSGERGRGRGKDGGSGKGGRRAQRDAA